MSLRALVLISLLRDQFIAPFFCSTTLAHLPHVLLTNCSPQLFGGQVLRNTHDVNDLNYILLYRLKLRKYMFVTVNVHFLFRSDEKLTVNENNIIFDKISQKCPFNNPSPPCKLRLNEKHKCGNERERTYKYMGIFFLFSLSTYSSEKIG